MSAKVTLIDIETSPNVGYTWGKYDQNVVRFVKEWGLLSIAWKDLGAKKTSCAAVWDYRDKTDKTLTKVAWKVLDAADVVVGHNLNGFDDKRLKAKFVEHGLPPPSPYKKVDTLTIARGQFGFNSNKLDDLARLLKLGNKVPHTGFDLWVGCMQGDVAAQALMKKYNIHDVELLEEIYLLFRAWYPAHPNLALYDGVPGCPACGGMKVHRSGIRVLKTRVVAQFHCQTPSCGSWFTMKVSE